MYINKQHIIYATSINNIKIEKHFPRN